MEVEGGSEVVIGAGVEEEGVSGGAEEGGGVAMTRVHLRGLCPLAPFPMPARRTW